MLNSRTLFVLGAGASAAYGLPVGASLNRQILQLCREASQSLTPLRQATALPDTEYKRFADEFRDSGLPSVDSFLARRDEYLAIGRAAIAAALIQLENPEGIDTVKPELDWYRFLWAHLQESYRTPIPELWSSIRIVTFNYDRSLEYFLWRAIRATFGSTDGAAFDELKKLPILHAYGQLGAFEVKPTYSIEGRVYAPDVTADNVIAGAQGIRVIPQARDEDPVFDNAREWASWAESICFLGFGFDALNCKRLNFQRVFGWRGSAGDLPKVYSTVFKMEPGEADYCVSRLARAPGILASTLNVVMDNADCLTALRRWPIWT